MLTKVLEFGSRVFGLCGHGKEMNWSVRLADRLFVDCACCLLWRGVFLGMGLAVIGQIIIAAIVVAVLHFKG